MQAARGGSFFKPIVLTDMTTDRVITKEEAFGTMPPLYRLQTDAETIEMANDTEFGLAAYLKAITRARGRPVDLSGGERVVGIAGVGETDTAPGRQ